MENSPQIPKYIGCQKLAVGALSELPVDPYGRPPTVGFLTVGATVDRATGAESELSVGRPVRSAELSREQSSLKRSTDTVGRSPVPKGVHVCARRSTEPVDRLQC